MEWEMLGWVSVRMSGLVSAGRGLKSPRLARKAVRRLGVCVLQTRHVILVSVVYSVNPDV